ncbi:MAG: amino acid permease [Sandaracinaceae bacterium]|nr:amino acid permease [Sandaracinaceae bacterium]
MREHERRIKGRTAAFLVVASMVGTGVFTTSGLLLEQLGSAPAVLLAWVLGGVLALTGALSYAELVAALPRNGGEYQLLSEVYHPSIGFSSGVVSFVVGFSAPVAASAIAFGSYLHAAWPAVPATPAALGLIVAMCAIHGVRVGVGSDAQDALTAFKILLIVGFVVAGAGSLHTERLALGTRPLLDASLSPAFAVALIYVTFSYSGWNAATYVAGELENPGRSLPIALISGTAVVTVLYLAVNVVFLAGAPPEALRGVVEVGAVAAEHMLGQRAGQILSAIIALGLVSTVGALIMTGTRVLDAMGRDHGPLAALARRATGGGPFVAVGLQGVLATIMVLTSSFDALLGYIGFTLSIFAALTVLGVIVLRVRQPDLERPYRTWGYPVTPIVFVGGMLWMIVWSIAAEWTVAVAGAVTIGAGLALWLVIRRG